VKRTLLPLNALRVFDAAARHLSFTKAADELAVTPAAVGQQIRALEEMLGVVLFRRLTRNLELTPEAERALPSLRAGFLAFEESVRELQSWQGSRKLTIAAPRDFAAHWLMPRLARYRDERPEVALAILSGPDQVDFAQANVDAAVLCGALPESEPLRSVDLGARGLVVVAPASSAGPDVDAGALPRIHQPGTGWDSAPAAADGQGPATVEVEDDGLALEAVAAGLGVARVPRAIADRYIAEGRVTLLHESDGGPEYRLAAPEPQWRQPKVKALVEFLTRSG
jgi:LysR family glycine cleavage system transcriptional activator